MGNLLFKTALLVGKCVYGLTKILPGISGTTWPGGFACMIKKDFVSCFQFKEDTKVVMVTGTSGKTTTTGMLAQLVKSEGKTICTNAVGANMGRGVATALIRSAGMNGRVNADYVILEVDERYIPLVSKQIKPDIILVTNVLKDQSQRNGEPGVIMEKIKSAITPGVHLILNRDEPNCASLGVNENAETVSYYGVTGNASELTEDGKMTVASSCPVCSSAIRYEYENLLNIGKFHCSGCSLHSEEEATVVAPDREDKKIQVGEECYSVKYTSTDFMYCYASMIAFARHEGFAPANIQKSIEEFKIQSGRVEKMKVGEKTINYLRIKQETPVTLQSAINVTSADKNEKIVVMDLSEVVDFTPNYAGVYYSYDCDFSKLVDKSVVRYICMSDVVCYEEAIRLVLEGVAPDNITILPTHDYDSLLQELEKYDCKTVYLLTWMHSYYDCLNSVKKYEKGKNTRR